MFSELTQQFNQPLNPLYTLKNTLLQQGHEITDLTSGNVTQHGIQFPAELLREALALGVTESIHYAPNPLGQPNARNAISHWYGKQGVDLPPDQLVMTPGTSFAYWYAFKLLANAGDEILCPTPNYPLFDSIASVSNIRISHYPLMEQKNWRIDVDGLKKAITKKTRAIVIISPHNPTGMVATDAELAAIAELATDHNLAIIVDEVFQSFMFTRAPYPRFRTDAAPLILTLNGFSKMLALAGLKIGWIGVTGNSKRVAFALRGLDTLSDTFLPVADATQLAVPLLLAESGDFQRHYRAEIAHRAASAVRLLQGIPGVHCPMPMGGFYTLIKLPESIHEDTLALALLERDHLMVHPGYFYDVEGDHLVISHVAKVDELRAACGSLTDLISAQSP